MAQRVVGALGVAPGRSLILGLAVWWGNPAGYVVAFLLMGRTQAQLASLMHESAHRLLFANRRANDFVGRWLLGYPASRRPTRTGACTWRTTARSSGPTSPTSRSTPATRSPGRASAASWCATRPGGPGSSSSAPRPPASARPTARVRHTLWKILSVQAVLLGAAIAGRRTGGCTRCSGCCRILTVWRVINRLRSIAEHGGMDASAGPPRDHAHRAPVLVVPHRSSSRSTSAGTWPTTSTPASRCATCPAYHRALRDAGYVTPELEYPGYRALWRALRTGTRASAAPST